MKFNINRALKEFIIIKYLKKSKTLYSNQNKAI